jgi:excisionase family DNA binding protein
LNRLPPSLPTPWLSLGAASNLLGVTPATLRRWADHGDVATFVTPGGHRRFRRSEIEALVPAQRDRRPQLTGLGAAAKRVATAYRRTRPAGKPAATPWLASLSDAQRAEFRERGHGLLAILLDCINEESLPLSAGKLAEAVAEATEYGRRAASLGASQSETVEAFVRFREAFIGELASIARRRRLDTREATLLLVEAEKAADRLLVALTNGHASKT